MLLQDANPTPSFGGFGLTHGSAIPLIKPGSAVQTNETTSLYPPTLKVVILRNTLQHPAEGLRPLCTPVP